MSVADQEAKSGDVLDDRASLEQVRELLFGAQSRDLARKAARIEARVASELGSIREELRRRFSELETHVQRELEAMSSRIDAESVARVDAVASIGRELREAGTSFELRVNRVDEAAAKNQRELRRQLLERTQSLSESIRKSREELLAAFEAEQDRDEGAPEEAERVSAH